MLYFFKCEIIIVTIIPYNNILFLNYSNAVLSIVYIVDLGMQITGFVKCKGKQFIHFVTNFSHNKLLEHFNCTLTQIILRFFLKIELYNEIEL